MLSGGRIGVLAFLVLRIGGAKCYQKYVMGNIGENMYWRDQCIEVTKGVPQVGERQMMSDDLWRGAARRSAGRDASFRQRHHHQLPVLKRHIIIVLV